jgi:lipoprotein-anchoring transpeptidase ErfK/SrfK
VFKILQKDKHHHSSTYNNAPMPNMNRLTWSGIALHAGNLPGFPASHGCVRLPLDFSARLFGITKVGMTVVIADAKSFPATVVHPTLFLDPSVDAEFDAVSPAITAAAKTESATGQAKATTVVVSAADRTARVYDGATEVASGPVTISNPDDPIGEMIYSLSDHDPKAKTLKWSAAATSGQSAVDTDVLRRIQLDDDVLAAARDHAHAGMALVTTDGSSGPENRSDPDFVVMTSDHA